MHIKDGFLTPDVCVGTGIVALGALAWSLREQRTSLSDRTVPLIGMTASLIFAGQMVNFPLPPLSVSGHLMGGVLAGALLGPWAGYIAISLVLFMQLLLYYDGGWTVLGANVVNMGVVGTWGGYALYAALRNVLGKGKTGTCVAGFLAAWLSVMAAATVFCLEFWLGHGSKEYNFSQVFGWMVFLHCLIGLGEGLITAGVLGFVHVQRPDLLNRPVASTALHGTGRWVAAGLVMALAVASVLAPFASGHLDGLDTVAERTGFVDLSRTTRVLVWDDYSIPALKDWPVASTAAAGVIGTLAVFAVGSALSWLIKRRKSAAT